MNPHWWKVSSFPLWILTIHLWVHKECCPACSASHSSKGYWTVMNCEFSPLFLPHLPLSSLVTVTQHHQKPLKPSWLFELNIFYRSLLWELPVGDNSLNKTIPYKPCKKDFGNLRKCLSSEQWVLQLLCNFIFTHEPWQELITSEQRELLHRTEKTALSTSPWKEFGNKLLLSSSPGKCSSCS